MSAREIRATAIVLAAGDGKRMKSGRPKVLHQAAGKPLLAHVLSALRPLPIEKTIVVTSTSRDEVAAAMEEAGFAGAISYAIQEPRRGTADALKVGLAQLDGSEETILVLPGDTPLLETRTLEALLHVHLGSSASATVLSARISDPTGYGRVVRSTGREVERIVEERDASYQDRTVDEINAGVYVFDAAGLAEVLDRVDRENSQGEYYLTDIIALLRAQDRRVHAYRTHPQEVLGVNSRAGLARVTELLRRSASERWMDQGVTIVDPTTTYIDSSVTIGRDAVVHPFTFLEGATSVAERAEVGPQARVVDSSIGVDARVSFSVVIGSEIGQEASVGPFASLRPGTRLERKAKVGTFVEVKQSTIGEDSKANHLSYIGNAAIGKGANVGAGTITCNWDGVDKHETVIDDDVYVGSDTMLVAPVRLGLRAATGAGAVVTGDVPEDGLAVGMPARVIEGRGNKMSRAPRESGDGDAGDRDPRQ